MLKKEAYRDYVINALCGMFAELGHGDPSIRRNDWHAKTVNMCHMQGTLHQCERVSGRDLPLRNQALHAGAGLTWTLTVTSSAERPMGIVWDPCSRRFVISETLAVDKYPRSYAAGNGCSMGLHRMTVGTY